MRPLYEIANEYQSLLAQVINCDEISPEMFEEFQGIQGDIKDKAVNVAAFIKNLEAEAEGIEKAIDAMQERAKRINKKVDSLRDYLKLNLESCHLNEVKSPFFDIRVRTNPASVAIMDEKLIPEQYFREIMMRKVDKLMLSQELKNNVMIPGVALEKRTRLEIK